MEKGYRKETRVTDIAQTLLNLSCRGQGTSFVEQMADGRVFEWQPRIGRRSVGRKTERQGGQMT